MDAHTLIQSSCDLLMQQYKPTSYHYGLYSMCRIEDWKYLADNSKTFRQALNRPQQTCGDQSPYTLSCTYKCIPTQKHTHKHTQHTLSQTFTYTRTCTQRMKQCTSISHHAKTSSWLL